MKKITRGVTDKNILDIFAEDFCRIIEKYTNYFICSGFVSIAHGRSRATEDIDMIIEKIPKETFTMMHKDLVKNNFICMQSDNPEKIYSDYLIQGNSIRYVRKSKGMFPPEMELKFVKDSLDEEQMQERRTFPLTKLNLYFSSIESNIAFKEEYLQSDKDMEDAKHLRIIYEESLDENKINKIKEKIRRLRL